LRVEIWISYEGTIEDDSYRVDGTVVIVFGAAAVVTSSPTVAQASPEVSPVENVLYTPPDTAQPLIEPVSSTFTIEQAAKLFLSGVTVFSLVAVALTIIITQLLTFRANRTIRQK
jgi:hypothetical protein